ncbi:DUF3140 domain-containing protein [Arsenicibacter rosenii]|uniref:DNA-binding protein n=1 Tax=Arsenicibacter rosenii TaxID=1750698 RepID=A0A1S2VI26_9BACT|nr:DUF3140 domain-containing protein [Arsenicibacter rosenii]OIN58060.1 DNA-binding protein [Arsenicibacter rosenii]
MATITVDDKEKKDIRAKFEALVNMTPKQIESWLKTDESKAVGQKKGDSTESIGHQSGEKIIHILQKKVSELDSTDYEHMQKVVSYIKRHSAQKPAHPEESNWAYSLKNWGHDPTK